MTPEEKAKELVDKFIEYACEQSDLVETNAKQCALICADEMIELAKKQFEHCISSGGINSCVWICKELSIKYCKEIKQEIEKL